MTTLDRVKAHLTDHANFLRKDAYGGVRKAFTTRNGITLSIQQSRMHYCSLGQGYFADYLKVEALPDTTSTATVEMWNCEHSPLLEPYGGGSDPYGHVPLAVVAAYIDSIEA